MEPVPVKPGWTTTEFWMTTFAAIVGLLVAVGAIGQDDVQNVNDALANAVKSVGGFVAAAGILWKYIQSRATVKAAVNTAVTSENNLKVAVLGANAVRVVGLLLVCLFLIPPQVYAQAPVPSAPVVDTAKPVAKAAAKERGNHALNLRDRRAMGLTIPNLLTLAKELRTEGAVDDDATNAEEAAALAMKLREKSPHAFTGANAMDWESIISYIEKLIPILRMLLSFLNQPAPNAAPPAGDM